MSMAKSGFSADPAPGCFDMVNDFCSDLYSKDHAGNLDLDPRHSDPDSMVRLGRTANDLSFPYYRLSSARLDAFRRFPEDFRRALEKNHYAHDVKKLFSSRPIEKERLKDHLADIHFLNAIDNDWDTAFSQTVFERMAAQFPGLERVRNTPPAVGRAFAKERARLRTEIIHATWETTPEWARVKQHVEDFRTQLIKIAEEQAKIPGPEGSIGSQWLDRLRALTLIFPGDRWQELAYDKACAETEVNAFYEATTNTVTVCGGFMTSVPPYQVLGHEMAHSMGPYATMDTISRDSGLGLALKELKTTSCSTEPMDCASWERWKAKFPALLKEFDVLNSEERYQPAEFLKCLAGETDLDEIEAQDLIDEGKAEAKSAVSDSSENETFLSLIKDHEVLGDGSHVPNPAYLNPCGLTTNVIDDSPNYFATETFFVNEFRCSAKEDPLDKIEGAVNTAEEMTASLNQVMIPLGRRYSSNSWMKERNLAKEVDERLADTLGMQATSSYFMTEPSQETRRQHFLASTGWLCPEPSLTQEYPDEVELLHQHSMEPHSSAMKRFQELLVEPMRNALGCQKDFELTECRLRD